MNPAAEKPAFGKRIGVIGTQSSTMNCVSGLMRRGYRVDHMIALPPQLKKGVADYRDLGGFAAEKNIPLTYVESYGMNDSKSRGKIENTPLDIVVCVGWQRLIPQWFLDQASLGVYGMHGSSLPLPKGRGRSPMNWSILQERDRFYTYLYRYDAGVDSGGIVDVQRFDICSWDTIQTLQHKNTVSQILLLLKNLPLIASGKAPTIAQDKQIVPSYYPKRTFEDGAIDWKQWTAREIHALVRAVARPYPGAYTRVGEDRIMIWRAVPFDSCIQFRDCTPGQIAEVFADGSFVVQCFTDSLIVLEYESQTGWKPEPSVVFDSLRNNSWKKLAEMRMAEESDAGER